MRSIKAASPYPPIADNDYVTNFLTWGLVTYQAAEVTYWLDILRTAHPQGIDSKLMAVRELGNTIFSSAKYAERPNRDCLNSQNAHNYVEDLYWTYLMRSPLDDGNSEGWDFWANQCVLYDRDAVRAGFYQSIEFAEKVGVMYPNGLISSDLGSISNARVDPFNQTGDQLRARDVEWSMPLLSLPGRAGLDLGLGLSYSSMVWMRSGPYLYFDEDMSPISPGFRLGLLQSKGPTLTRWLARKSSC